jgi:undecaprenyl-diphosphatase
MGLAIVSFTAFALAGSLNVYRHHSSDTARYAFKPVVETMMASDWWGGGWERLPSHRIDMFGEIEEPLTVKWAGGLTVIQQDLQNKGWRTPAPWTATNALGWLTAKAAPVELPVVPRLASGRLPTLTLVLANDKMPDASRFVLRLWQSDLELTGRGSSTVWSGSVVEESFNRPLSLVTTSKAQSNANAPRDLLLGAAQSARLARRSGTVGSARWDARVLLLEESSP